MTPQEEHDRYRYLMLKQKEAMGAQTQTETAPEQTLPQTIQASAQQAMSPLAMLAQKLQPKNLTSLLSVAGAAAGTAMAPGVGTAAGAGLGSIAQKMADMAYGNQPQVEPTTSVMGIPMAPKEAIWPAANAAMAGFPETEVGQKMGEVGGKVLGAFKQRLEKPLKQVGQMLTGKSAAKVGMLMKDPTAILPESLGGAMSPAKASQQYGEALDNTSNFHPEGYVTRGIDKIEFSPFGRGQGEADNVAQTVYDKWKAGEQISPKEAFDAKRATDYVWPAIVKERNAEKIRLMSEFKTAMDDVMSNPEDGMPKMLKASKDYARARLGADFTQILPRTKTGDISTVKTLLMHTLDPGRSASLLGAGLTSPMVTGIGNLAGQTAMKGLNVLSKDPAARQMLLQALQQILAGQGQAQ